MRSGLIVVVFALGAVALAGCPRAELVTCGDLLCPATARCLAGACVDRDQLAACDGRAELDACSAGALTGSCIGGVCTPVGCGNSVIDFGEVCDDGNTVSGDGCRADCRGLEVCGDGFLDVDEACDCGADEATRPANCASPNDEAPSAACDPACGRFCGDGEITGFEQCDGTNLGGRTCASLGFYTGELACAQCVFDATGCSEQCGDGIVQPGGGEDCDGAPPVFGCVDVGTDLGHLGCSARCTADILVDCGLLGWQVAFAGTKVRDLWTDGTRIGIAAASEAIVREGPTQVTFAGAFLKVAGDAAAVWFVGATQTVRYAGGVWTTFPGYPSPSGFDATVHAAGVDPLGRLVVLRDFPCDVLALDGGAWVATGIGGGDYCDGGATDGVTAAIIYFTGGAARWNGTGWTPLPYSGTVNQVALIDGELWASTTMALYRETSQVLSGSFGRIAGGGGRIFAASSAGVIERIDEHERMSIPDGGPVALLAAGARGPLIAGVGSVVRSLRHGIWLTEPVPSGVLSTTTSASAVHRTDDGLVIVGTGASISTPTGWKSAPLFTTPLDLVWGASRHDFWAAGSEGLMHAVDYPTTAPVVVAGPWGAASIVGLDGVMGQPLVATSTQIYRGDGAGGWTAVAVPTGCRAHTIAGGPSGAVFVGGACNTVGRLWQLDQGALVERYAATMSNTALGGVTVTTDGTAFAIGRAIVRWDGTTVTTYPLMGTAISGRASDDVWAISPTDGGPSLVHWDGETWARVRTADVASYRDLAVGERDVLLIRTDAAQRLLLSR